MEQNILYTLAFLKRKDEILMLNRIKNPWQGMWNGGGGKRGTAESPLDCIIREIEEETGISVTKEQVHFCGTLSWNNDFKAASRVLYIFYIELAMMLFTRHLKALKKVFFSGGRFPGSMTRRT